MHNAVLQPLQPARRYYYKFGSSFGGWSQVYSFLAPRVAGDTTTFTFLYGQHFAVQYWAASVCLTGVQVHR